MVGEGDAVEPWEFLGGARVDGDWDLVPEAARFVGLDLGRGLGRGVEGEGAIRAFYERERVERERVKREGRENGGVGMRKESERTG